MSVARQSSWTPNNARAFGSILLDQAAAGNCSEAPAQLLCLAPTVAIPETACSDFRSNYQRLTFSQYALVLPLKLLKRRERSGLHGITGKLYPAQANGSLGFAADLSFSKLRFCRTARDFAIYV